MMLSGNRRLKVLLVITLAQISCVGLGFWLHYHFEVTAVSQQAEPTALRGSLAGAAVIGWAWSSALLAIVTYLVGSKIYDTLGERRSLAEAESLRRIQSLIRTRDAVIFGLASLAESRDEITGRHVERVSFYASRLAAAATQHPKFRDAITPAFIQVISIAAVLHDIGKVGIEDGILFKPGRLTDSERARMQHHATLGGRYLADIERRLGSSHVVRMAREIALWHHERWDGKGYPHGLKGEETPLPARLAAIADVYEALTSLRDYKPPYSHQRSVEIIRGEAGKQFDPDLVGVFLQIEGLFHRFVFEFGDDEFRKVDPQSQRPETSATLECAGLVSAMKVLDEDWTVPVAAHYWR